MPEPIVSPDSGTVAVLDQPKVEVKEEPKPQTMADVEAKYKEDFDKKHGRDITKLFPVSAPKKAEPKIEAKVETPVPDAKVEPKVEEPKKKLGGFARTVSRLNRQLGAKDATIQQLEQRLTTLEGRGTPAPTVVVDTVREPVKPKRAECATTEEYLDKLDKYMDEVREYDRKSLTRETKTELAKRDETVQAAEATARWNTFVEMRDEFKKTTPDYDEVVDGCEVGFNTTLVGLITTVMDSIEGPKLFYDMAKDTKQSKNLNKLTEQAIASIGASADDIPGVVRYLMANPDQIAKLNTLDNVKSAKFVGIIETKLEATPKKEEPKTEVVAPLPAKDASQEAEPKPQAQAEPARRQRPEPPPKVSGSAPAPTDWKEPQEMTLEERERLFREDPRNKRR